MERVEDHDLIAGEKRTAKLSEIHRKDGFREGYDIGRERKLQEGFNFGFKHAANISFSLSSLQFLLESLLTHDFITTKQETRILELIEQIKNAKKQAINQWEISVKQAQNSTRENNECESDQCECKPNEEKQENSCCSEKNSGQNCCKSENQSSACLQGKKEDKTILLDITLEEQVNSLISEIFPGTTELFSLSQVNPFRSWKPFKENE